MREYTDCVNQKIKGGAVSICPTCIHHNICKVIDNQPCIECSQFIRAADVRPVVRGKWIEDWETGYSECPACHDTFLWEDYKGVAEWNFCPNCGARMEES